jgi:MFS family permease
LHSTTNLADGEERRFAPKAKRARILASVFFMQACGILAASVVSVVVVAAVQAQNPDVIPRAVDHIWRWMMGLSLIPATFAVVIRLSIPESPRYTLDVLDDPYKAFEEANRFNESQGARLSGTSHSWSQTKPHPSTLSRITSGSKGIGGSFLAPR